MITAQNTFCKSVSAAQNLIRDQGFDGWLLFDYKHSNDLACQFLGLSDDAMLTRRFFYWIPVEGEPVKVVHRVEASVLEHLPGEVIAYSSWEELREKLSVLLRGVDRIAMEYSSEGRLPVVSKVDGGTLDMVRSLGVLVKSSANLLQVFTCSMSKEQLASHVEAVAVLDQAVDKAWAWIFSSLEDGKRFTEYDVAEKIRGWMGEAGCVTDAGPICAVGANAADPHYCPTQSKAAVITSDVPILIDLWCKKNTPEAIYGDICRVGFTGEKPPSKYCALFEVVKRSQAEAFSFLKSRAERGKATLGYQLDQVARNVIEDEGFGNYFVHRTGHNIFTEDHGPGAHLDSFETRDDRELLPMTCFSIEPGIYLPNEMGVRLEYNVYLDEDGIPHISGNVQDELRIQLRPKA